MKLTKQDHTVGNEEAHASVVQYGDYMSSESRNAHDTVMRLLDAFPAKILFAYRHFVHDRVNRDGFIAALAAEAAGAQGYFWEFHSKLIHLEGAVTSPEIVRSAESIGLDMARFLKDISHKTYSAKIKDDLESGAVNGVMIVPAFFVNRARLISGFSAETLTRAVQACL